MRYALTILFALSSLVASAQITFNFAATRSTDTSKTSGYMYLPVYATSDTDMVLGVDSRGIVILRNRSGGSAGTGTVTSVGYVAGYGMTISGTNPITSSGTWTYSVDSSQFATLARLYKVGDSIAALLPDLSGYIPYTDTSGIISTIYQLDTAKSTLRTEIIDGDAAVLSALDDTAAAIRGTIPSVSGYIPYSGATQDGDIGTHSFTAKDLIANHASGSGTALSVTKGGAGYAVEIEKTSGSGNAMSVTGGATELEELQLTTLLSDAYISSAATWNAKYGSSDTASLLATQYFVTSQGYITSVDSSVYSTKAYRQKGIDSVVGIGYITSSYLMRTFTTTNVTTTVDMDADTYNNYRITAQAGNLELEISASSPFHGQILTLDINSDGKGHTITYDASINNTGDAPTALSATSTTTTTWVFRYNGSGDWDYINSFEIEH